MFGDSLCDAVQCKSRWETCELHSTEARNEYLLNLAATNGHLLRYYNTNLPELLAVRLLLHRPVSRLADNFTAGLSQIAA